MEEAAAQAGGMLAVRPGNAERDLPAERAILRALTPAETGQVLNAPERDVRSCPRFASAPHPPSRPPMKRILLVDDEPETLVDLKARLTAVRAPWDVVCATSSDEALDLLANEPCDLVVSDAEQEAQAGRSLFTEVKGRYPSIVRLMILDAGEKAAAARASGEAHMYLPRTCSGELLRTSVARATALRDVLTNTRLLELVRKLDHLPSMPTLYFQLVEAMKDPNATIESLGAIISRDIGMTAKVLKLVNSPLFGLREKIVAPGQAATFLGLDTLKSLVLSVGVFSQFDQQDLEHVSAQESWEHAMKVAGYTRALLQCERASKTALEEGFLAGMMHDAGKLVLASNRPQRFHAAEVFAKRDDGSHQLRTDLERRLFGASHAAVGGYLLGQWGLPSGVIEAVMFHHTPRLWIGEDFGPLCAVHVANALAHVDLDDSEAVLMELDEAFLERLGLAGRLPRWIEACRELDRASPGE